MPYAEAIVYENAKINVCTPGGVKTLKVLRNLLKKDITPYISDMKKNAKPTSRVFINEAECIGCTKCITACPVDAIIGAGKLMHTVLTDICTGCDLCIPPCPVACISTMEIPEDPSQQKSRADIARSRFLSKQKRLAKENLQNAKLLSQKHISQLEKKEYIKAAIQRAKSKAPTS